MHLICALANGSHVIMVMVVSGCCDKLQMQSLPLSFWSCMASICFSGDWLNHQGFRLQDVNLIIFNITDIQAGLCSAGFPGQRGASVNLMHHRWVKQNKKKFIIFKIIFFFCSSERHNSTWWPSTSQRQWKRKSSPSATVLISGD